MYHNNVSQKIILVVKVNGCSWKSISVSGDLFPCLRRMELRRWTFSGKTTLT
ncbi:MAG TPA: hypothetical protein VJ440_11400 [Candidatus Brocadiaceae bacterium]|nr:hypothetical protein [Candidatus Brocadiaceae bacterium]